MTSIRLNIVKILGYWNKTDHTELGEPHVINTLGAADILKILHIRKYHTKSSSQYLYKYLYSNSLTIISVHIYLKTPKVCINAFPSNVLPWEFYMQFQNVIWHSYYCNSSLAKILNSKQLVHNGQSQTDIPAQFAR